MITFGRSQVRGHSLVELLVSLFIASVIMGGVVSVVQTSSTTFLNEEESSFIQENIRYSMELLSRDIRLAGNFGCADMQSAKIANVVDNTHSGLYSMDAVEGFESDPLSVSPAPSAPGVLTGLNAGSDALIVRYADPEQSLSVRSHSDSGFTFHSTPTFEQGDHLVVVDSTCRHLGVFQNTASGSSSSVEHASSMDNCTSEIFADTASYDCSPPASSALSYSAGSTIMPFVANAYFIADSNVIPGMPALKRRSLTSSGYRSDELAQGVESMSFIYGLDTDDPVDGDVNVFLRADQITDWENVIAVRFNLVFRSQSPVYDADQTVTLNDTEYSDRFLRQVASATVRMRNR